MDSDLLKLAADEEQKTLEAHQNRVQFVTGLMSALAAANVAGLIQAKEFWHFIPLLAGPGLLFAVSRLGRRVSGQFYERYLRSVTVRAKLEQRLGLTVPRVADLHPGYWGREAIVPTSHLESRKATDTSKEWIESKLGTGYDGSAQLLFDFFAWLAGFLLLVTVSGGVAAGVRFFSFSARVV